MADKLDLLMSDYMTGMLQVKINSRELWITRQKNEERIGSSGTSSNTAPQERRMMILEEDTKLQKMKDQKETMDNLMRALEGTTIKEILTYKFKYRLSWENVGIRVRLEESAARKQYKDFKRKFLKDGLWASVFE